MPQMLSNRISAPRCPLGLLAFVTREVGLRSTYPPTIFDNFNMSGRTTANANSHLTQLASKQTTEKRSGEASGETTVNMNSHLTQSQSMYSPLTETRLLCR